MAEREPAFNANLSVTALAETGLVDSSKNLVGRSLHDVDDKSDPFLSRKSNGRRKSASGDSGGYFQGTLGWASAWSDTDVGRIVLEAQREDTIATAHLNFPVSPLAMQNLPNNEYQVPVAARWRYFLEHSLQDPLEDLIDQDIPADESQQAYRGLWSPMPAATSLQRKSFDPASSAYSCGTGLSAERSLAAKGIHPAAYDIERTDSGSEHVERLLFQLAASGSLFNK